MGLMSDYKLYANVILDVTCILRFLSAKVQKAMQTCWSIGFYTVLLPIKCSGNSVPRLVTYAFLRSYIQFYYVNLFYLFICCLILQSRFIALLTCIFL